VVSFFSGDYGGVCSQRKVNTRVRDQVGLEFSQVNIQGTIESQRCSDGGDDLANKPVQVGVGRSFDVEVSAADVVDCFVIDHKSAI